MNKRVFLIVLDSFGIGSLPDADIYGDVGANTLRSVASQKEFDMSNMKKLGLFNIDGVDFLKNEEDLQGSFGRMAEVSKGKDTTTGHWEIAGLNLNKPFPVFPDGFPKEIIEKFEKTVNRKVICNKPYSGTEVIKDYGKEHMETGNLIVYTSADSVFQIAAHEDIVPIEELYTYCQKARELLIGDFAVGRVIARPFTGDYPNFTRTRNRHDFSLKPIGKTMLDILKENNHSVISVGKIGDIFCNEGITESNPSKGNTDGMEKTLEIADRDFDGLCFVNLVDFDMLYGHRNDAVGYAKALNEFDRFIPDLSKKLKRNDIVIITADHGCDPLDDSTDHSREYVPLVIFGENIRKGMNLGTRSSFSDISATILEYFNLPNNIHGQSFLQEVLINV